MSRCTGHCCRCFYLPINPAELAALVDTEIRHANFAMGSPETPHQVRALILAREWEGRALYRILDIIQIADMVEYLGWMTPQDRIDGAAGREPGNYYRCKNLQANGDCGIYEDRPMMCRGYPYGRACSYRGCTMNEACSSAS